MTAALQSSVVKGDGELGARCGLGDALLEGGRSVDREACAITHPGHLQGGLQTLWARTARDLQLLAVIANGREADAVNDRPLLGDAVRRRSALVGVLDLQGVWARPAGHGIALESLGSSAGAQGAKGLRVAFARLDAQPVRPSQAPVFSVDLLALLEVLLADGLQVVLERLAGRGVQDLFAGPSQLDQLDRRPLEPPAALGRFDQASLAINGSGPFVPSQYFAGLLLGLVAGVHWGGIDSRAHRLACIGCGRRHKGRGLKEGVLGCARASLTR